MSFDINTPNILMACLLHDTPMKFNSQLGFSPTEFFGHLMSQLYINNDADAIFICGDLNARCGNGIDTL